MAQRLDLRQSSGSRDGAFLLALDLYPEAPAIFREA
jgi:hypothetical protein